MRITRRKMFSVVGSLLSAGAAVLCARPDRPSPKSRVRAMDCWPGAVKDGEYLRVVRPCDIETLRPGLYSMGEWRKFTGRRYNGSSDEWYDYIDQPEEKLVRIRDTGERPEYGAYSGTVSATNRRDGKAVVLFYHGIDAAALADW